MELDHDTGALEGWCLPAAMKAETLGTMAQQELMELYAELSATPRAASY